MDVEGFNNFLIISNIDIVIIINLKVLIIIFNYQHFVKRKNKCMQLYAIILKKFHFI